MKITTKNTDVTNSDAFLEFEFDETLPYTLAAKIIEAIIMNELAKDYDGFTSEYENGILIILDDKNSVLEEGDFIEKGSAIYNF